jgi:nitroreductase
MEFWDVLNKRYSVREYLQKPVEQEKLERVLEAARVAPSGSNRQPWKFVVVRDELIRRQMVEACCDQKFIGEAPVVIAGVGLMPDRVMRCDVPGDPVDLAIALEHIALAAANEGLGACWIGAFHQDKVRAVLGIPPTCKVIEVMTLGYPADRQGARNRKILDEIVCYDKWS